MEDYRLVTWRLWTGDMEDYELGTWRMEDYELVTWRTMDRYRYRYRCTYSNRIPSEEGLFTCSRQ